VQYATYATWHFSHIIAGTKLVPRFFMQREVLCIMRLSTVVWGTWMNQRKLPPSRTYLRSVTSIIKTILHIFWGDSLACVYCLISMLRRVLRPTTRSLARCASTQTHGLSAILQKNPNDVVITFAKRTAMGRNKKGQLKDAQVDKLLHSLFRVRRLHLRISHPKGWRVAVLGYLGDCEVGPCEDWWHLRR
jgi:hypothetical protein